jgi:hypothetical protein
MSISTSPDVLAAMPKSLRTSLSDQQRLALVGALGSRLWGRHAVNLRFSIPFPGGPYYIAIVADRERRGSERRAEERQRHPWRTVGNLAFLLGAQVLVCGLGILGILTYAAIIEF